jgi:hypothetical protein
MAEHAVIIEQVLYSLIPCSKYWILFLICFHRDKKGNLDLLKIDKKYSNG